MQLNCDYTGAHGDDEPSANALASPIRFFMGKPCSDLRRREVANYTSDSQAWNASSLCDRCAIYLRHALSLLGLHAFWCSGLVILLSFDIMLAVVRLFVNHVSYVLIVEMVLAIDAIARARGICHLGRGQVKH